MSKLSRRDALKLSLLTGAMPFIRHENVPRLRTDRLRLGVIGVGNRGAANLAAVRHEHVAALCDVDDRYLKNAATQHQGAATFRDYREMLDADLGLDAVVVSTPDHTHAPASMAAMQRGLHCYCEKPLTHSVEEAKAMAQLGKGLVTQMGTQIHAGDNYRRVVELMRSKPIGKVTEVHVWCGKDWSGGRSSAPKPSAPEYLDWKFKGVEINLDDGMEKTLSTLSKYPVTTAVSLSGHIIVARDIAHAKLKEILEAKGEFPDYFKKYPVYYAGPAKTPEGMASGSFGPTTAGRMDPYVDIFQENGASMVMLAKGNRSQQVTDACNKHGGFYLGSAGGPAALLAKEHIKSQEVVDFPELGMEAVWKIRVENFPAFILVDDKGNDFFTQINQCPAH